MNLWLFSRSISSDSITVEVTAVVCLIITVMLYPQKNTTANSSPLMKLDKVTFREYHIKFEQISLASLAISCLELFIYKVIRY